MSLFKLLLIKKKQNQKKNLKKIRILLQSAKSGIRFLSLSLCVCESDWVLERVFHGEKEGGNKKRREQGRENAE